MLDPTRLQVLVAVAKYGSVTAAAQALNYAQPSISHHMARLEAETGAKLMERAGRGIKLTEAGLLLAARAQEILGRLDAAEAELAAHVGLRQEQVRVAAFGSALSTLLPAAAAALRADRDDTAICLTQACPGEALRLLRAGAAEVALIFTYSDEADSSPPGPARPPGDPPGDDDLRRRLVLDEPVYLITPARPARESGRGRTGQDGDSDPAPQRVSTQRVSTQRVSTQRVSTDLADYARHRWIAGCGQCEDFLVRHCRAAGFAPDIAARTDDYVAVQALVAAGIGVAVLPGLALRGREDPAITATELPRIRRQVLAVTYGTPPDPPATARLVEAAIAAAAAC
ncbi:MAG TPA: LysR family transcriptional regulator [Streptosporangiaceae bacterium]|nr:LysR family transcriptional regulator [Streptosporangiaceae bacterium]